MKLWICTFALMAGGVASANNNAPQTFKTPEQARDALVQAAKSGIDALKDLFGPGSGEIIRTGDPVEDKILLDRFNKRAGEKIELVPDEMNPNRITVMVGSEEVPFPVPLLRKNGLWYFDVNEGKAEIRYRIIGGNELDAIQVCQGYVAAQRRYAETDWDRNGIVQYASKFVSSPGKKDGLYWPGDDSPVAEAVARAAQQGYARPNGGTGKPFHGYLYRILTAQGPDADGGARDYIVHGYMIGGFALIAWPAEYGVSGFKTFIVNQDGIVYEKDFGPQTATIVKTIKTFNPDRTWQVPPQDTP